MNNLKMGRTGRWMFASAVALGLSIGIVGCSSKEEKALAQAKQQAVATGQPQQITSVDKNGNTITTIVQPPAQGQKDPTIVTTTAPPTAGQPKPAAKPPVVTPVQDAEIQQWPQDGPVGSAQDQQANQKPAAGQYVGQAPQQQAAARRGIAIPAGTSLAVRVDQTISVKTAHAGEGFSGELAQPVMGPDGNVLVPKLTRVRGVIDASHKRGRFKGASELELRLTSMNLNGQEYPIETRDLAEHKKGKGKRTAAFIGGGSGLGMLIGGVATGGAGLLWGGLAGAGAGTAAAGFTGNRDLVIPAESVVRFKLAQDVVVQGN